jgi:membrane protease subunit (stomatin/prohibitin family)
MMAARAPENKGELVTRCKDEGFAAHAQITVDEGEAALLLRDGQLVGVLGPGRHTLMVEAYPFLQQLAEADGGYRATLVFASTNPVSGLKFGGKTAMMLDQQGGQGSARLFGQYTLRVADPGRFVTQMGVGDDADASEGALSWVNAQLTKRAGSCLAEWITGGYFTVQNAASAGPQLAQAVAPRCADFGDFGLELVSIDNIGIQFR